MATAKSRKERVEIARSRDILSVADELGMELVRTGQDFRWKEHDSMVITPKKMFGSGFLGIREEMLLPW